MISHEPLKISYQFGEVRSHDAIYATVPRHRFPIGFMWLNHVMRNTIDIGYVFVNERYRRQGVAIGMLNEIIEWWPRSRITTGMGNSLSTPWLIKNNFINSEFGWVRPNRGSIIIQEELSFNK